jgi:polar amino acid transport system permease protein
VGEALLRSLDLSLFWEYRETLAAGLLRNVLVFAGGALLATALAVAVGLARVAGGPALRGVATLHAELFRNVPEYVLLVWLHYVVPILLSRATGGRVTFDPVLSAVLALGLAYSGFLSETVRAGILSVPRGHVEAALALGMGRGLAARRIVAPQAARRMLPEALNQYVSLFKATSFISLIAVEDVMYRVSMITVYEMRPLPLYTGAALMYCAVIVAAATLVRRLTDRWRRRGWA